MKIVDDTLDQPGNAVCEDVCAHVVDEGIKSALDLPALVESTYLCGIVEVDNIVGLGVSIAVASACWSSATNVLLAVLEGREDLVWLPVESYRSSC